MKVVFIAMALIGMMVVNGHAIELRDPASYEPSDVEVYLSGDTGSDRLAGGLCVGPLKEIVNDRGEKIGGLLSSCALVAMDVSLDPAAPGNKSTTMAGLQVFDIGGLSFVVAMDLFDNGIYYGFGLSVLQLVDKLGGEQ